MAKGRAFGYIRVSATDGGEGVSEKSQAKRIESAAMAKDLKLVRHFTDLDISGVVFSRPGLDELLRTIQAGDTLIAIETSRLGRNHTETWLAIDGLKSRGVFVWCLDNNFDTSTEAGCLALQIKLSVDEYERKQTRTRTQNAKKTSREVGRWQGGTVPTGYRLSPKGHGSLELDPKTAPLVQLMFELRAVGNSYPAISDEVNRRGLRGQRGGRVADNSSAIILRNPVYVGRARWGGTEYELDPKCVPRLIEQSLWDQVQSVNEASRITKVRRGTYLCSGILKCASCGSPMVRRLRFKESGTVTKSTGSKTLVAVDYRCFSAHNQKEATRRGLKRCKAPAMIREHLVEDFIRDELCSRVDDEIIKAELGKKGDKISAKPDNNGNGTSSLRRKLIKIREKEGRLADLYIDGEINKDVLDERATALSAQAGVIEAEIRETEAGTRVQTNALAALAPFESLSAEWPEMNQEERRGIAGCFIQEVRVASRAKGTERVTISWR